MKILFKYEDHLTIDVGDGREYHIPYAEVIKHGLIAVIDNDNLSNMIYQN